MSTQCESRCKIAVKMINVIGVLLFMLCLDATAVTGNGLTSRLKLDEGSGSVTYDSVGSIDGTLTNMNTATCWGDGQSGKALEFDGSDDHVVLSDDISLSYSGSTISCWIKIDDDGDNCIFGNSTNSYCGYIRRTDDGRIVIECDNNNMYLSSAQHQLEDYNWHHLVVVFDGANSSIWLDGKSLTITNNSLDTGLTLDLIGVRKDQDYFNGTIDEILVYNRALNENEIIQLYQIAASNWNLDEESGATAYDDSADGNNGTLTNMDTGSCWVTGQIGNALEFDGIDDYVVLSDDLTLPLSGSSISCWIKINDDDDNCIFGSSVNSYCRYIQRTDDGRITVECNNNNKALMTSQHQLEDYDWHHLVVVFDGSNSSIWLDGETKSLTSNTLDADLTLDLIGVRKDQNYFNGIIDGIAVFNRALSADEIYKLYLAPDSVWYFDENSGSTAFDNGNDNDGTLTNMDTANCWIDGRIGKALEFDGSNDYVTLSDDITLSLSGSSISCWIKIDDDDDNCIFGNSTNSYCGYIRRTDDGRIVIECDNNNMYLSSAQHQLEDYNWHHLVVVFDGSNSSIWLDGEVLTLTNSTLDTDLTLDLIGVRKDQDYFSGTIDEIVVYKRALDSAAIAQLYYDGGGADGFGCEANPTGDPIGGGAGYSDIIDSLDAYDIISSGDDVDDLIDALNSASSGEIVYLDSTASIDASGEVITVPAGVTLAGNRGENGSNGALIYTNNFGDGPLLLINGTGVRITGLRLQGPGGTQEEDIIYTVYGDLEVDNCEIWNGHSGIFADDEVSDIYVHHNYIHDNSSYGVALDEAEALIEANIFEFHRHDVAGSGRPGTSYEARYNRVKPGNAHHFDMHAERDYRKDYTRTIWRFDEGSGTTVVDTSIYHDGDGTCDGTIYGTVAWSDDAMLGKALDFDGSSTYVSVGNDSSLQTARGNLEFWIKSASIDTNLDIFYMYEDSNNYLLVRRTSSNKIYVEIKDAGTAQVAVTSGTSIADTNWHHIVITQEGNGDGVQIFIDGYESTVTGINSNYWTDHLTLSDAWIGRGINYFDGIIDQFRIYEYRVGCAVLYDHDVEMHYLNGHADLAGDSILIHHNTFEDTVNEAVIIRGIPETGIEVYNNWFYHDPDPDNAVYQKNAQGNMDIYMNLYSDDRILIK